MPQHAGSAAELRAMIATLRGMSDRGEALSLTQVALPAEQVAGHTGFWSYSPEHRRVEIGFTWLAPPFRRSAINTETKLLMLGHAFEELDANRVEFKTDARNSGSRRALERIGASEEGALRAHMLLWNGSYRDSVYYSILRDEWPAVRQRLRALLDR